MTGPVRAAVLGGAGQAVEICELDLAAPGAGEVEVEIAAAGVCGSDQHVVISFGALAAFSFVNLSVVKTYIIDRGQRTGADIFKYGVLPFLGMAFTLYLWTQLSGLTFQIGLGWLAAGFVALLVITRGFRVAPPPMYTGDEEEAR